MTDRDRLMKAISNAVNGFEKWRLECLMNESQDYKPIAEFITDYLLANGVICPPCKVGDKVYIIENPYTFLPLKKAVEGEVISIHLHEHGLFVRILFDTPKINGCVDYSVEWRFGKTVFLTKEEAEQKLKELKDNE